MAELAVVPAGESRSIAVRNWAIAIGGTIALIFAGWRSLTASRQAKTAASGHVTDRYSKAIEQLGQDTASGKPNLPFALVPFTRWAGLPEIR